MTLADLRARIKRHIKPAGLCEDEVSRAWNAGVAIAVMVIRELEVHGECLCEEPHLHGHVVGCEGGRR